MKTGILILRWSHEVILKKQEPDGTFAHMIFQIQNKKGLQNTIEAATFKFNPEYWNYAKLI